MTDEQIMRNVAKSLEQIADSLAKIETYLKPVSAHEIQMSGIQILPTTIYPPGTNPFGDE